MCSKMKFTDNELQDKGKYYPVALVLQEHKQIINIWYI